MKLTIRYACLLAFFLLSANLSMAQDIYINEIHYDNDGSDTAEGIEIAGPADTDLSGYSVVLYNGNNGETYGSISLNGIIPNQQGGYGTLSFPQSGLQNGSPDGLALVNNANDVIQFLSYEGSLTANNGPALGMTSTDIGVAESGSTRIGHSLQLGGTEIGQTYEQFTWQEAIENTFGAINTNQDFGGEVMDPDPEPEPEPETENGLVFVNEIHYDNSGTDLGEAIEVAGLAGTNLEGYSLVLYNGNGGAVYKTVDLSGIFADQQNGYGTIAFNISGIQNGSPDGIALAGPSGLIQFLSYEGAFIASGGIADGIISTDIGVTEPGSGDGFSLQLRGEGTYYDDFTWADAASSTFNLPNNDQTFIAPEPVLFINEIHYDNSGSDANEAVEVAGTAGTDLSTYQLVFYNGNGGSDYKTIALEGTIPDQQGGYGTSNFLIAGIQNGSPDGIALVTNEGEVIQFLSYEGSFTAVGGPANGLTSDDIGLSEASSALLGHSLQLGGEGQSYEAFAWQESMTNTYGEINTNQSFGGDIVDPEPEVLELITIAEARMKPAGTKVWIRGILTVSDQFGNTAFIQDDTAGLAIFSELITEEGLFSVGSEFELIGTISAFRELVQITDLESVEFFGLRDDPQPVDITLSQLEDYRGQLVRITDIDVLSTSPILFGSNNYNIADASGMGELRIDGNVDDLVGKALPEFCEEIIGVVGRFETINQLLPRQSADMPCAEEYVNNYPGKDISQEVTFEVVTWNIEWFGSATNSPASGAEDSDAVQKAAVKEILMGLDADVIAVQEITDATLFADMIGELEGYDFILSDGVSYPNDTEGESQRVGLVFKTDVISVTDTQILLASIHPYYNGGDATALTDYPVDDKTRFFASGRLPFLVTTTATIEGQTEDLNFVVLHARANTGNDQPIDYAMRRYDVEILKDTLDVRFPKANLFLLGDYNDDVDETVANDVTTTESSYIEYVNDADDYTVLTTVLSDNGFRSTVGFPDMIDHIAISDELTDNYIEGSATVHYEYYSSSYSFTASDHFPVSVRMVLIEDDNSCGNNSDKILMCFNGNSLCVSKNAMQAKLKEGAVLGSCENSAAVSLVPNPTYNNTSVKISGFTKGFADLVVTDLSGNLILSTTVKIPNSGSLDYTLDVSGFVPGIYLVKVQNNKGESIYKKLIVL